MQADSTSYYFCMLENKSKKTYEEWVFFNYIAELEEHNAMVRALQRFGLYNQQPFQLESSSKQFHRVF